MAAVRDAPPGAEVAGEVPYTVGERVAGRAIPSVVHVLPMARDVAPDPEGPPRQVPEVLARPGRGLGHAAAIPFDPSPLPDEAVGHLVTLPSTAPLHRPATPAARALRSGIRAVAGVDDDGVDGTDSTPRPEW